MTSRTMIAGLLMGLVTSLASANAVNINKADASELATAIKGIGMSKAQAIVDYRNKAGKFQTVDELTNVKGIGEKLLQRNRDAISVEDNK